MEFRVAQGTRAQRAIVPWAALFRCVQRLERATPTTSVALVVVPPKRMAALNLAYRGKTGPTDVLAFPVDERQPQRDGSGDVILCPAVLRTRFAGQAQPPLLAHRFVHALLHLHGYQHTTEVANQRMEKRVQHCLKTYYGPHYATQYTQ